MLSFANSKINDEKTYLKRNINTTNRTKKPPLKINKLIEQGIHKHSSKDPNPLITQNMLWTTNLLTCYLSEHHRLPISAIDKITPPNLRQNRPPKQALTNDDYSTQTIIVLIKLHLIPTYKEKLGHTQIEPMQHLPHHKNKKQEGTLQFGQFL